MPTAVGNVSVVADVPVNKNILSDDPAVVFPVKVVSAVEKDPLTSKVELGLVVPTPICACANKANSNDTPVNNFFMDWIF